MGVGDVDTLCCRPRYSARARHRRLAVALPDDTVFQVVDGLRDLRSGTELAGGSRYHGPKG